MHIRPAYVKEEWGDFPSCSFQQAPEAAGWRAPSGGAPGRGPLFLLPPSAQAWEDVDREWTCGVFIGAFPPVLGASRS